jgi:ABC-type bacteriocin/lantibiotic exporter with double-glycine peptidase domain
MNGVRVNRLLWPVMTALLGVAALARVFAADDTPKRPARFEIEGVPFVKQRSNWCGPAALASVLQYHGEKITQEEIAAAIYLPGRGTLNVDLLLFARRRGYLAAMHKGSSELLKETVAAGLPVICQVEKRDLLGKRTHFVVVYGYDDEKETYRLHQGTKGAVSVKQPAFEKPWARSSRWMLIVQPKPEAEGDDASS